MDDLRLTLTDQAFVNAVAARHLRVLRDPAEDQFLSTVARELLAGVSRGHRYIAPLIDASEAFEAAGSVLARENERLKLNAHLAEFFRWRMAMAMDRLQQEGATT